MDQNREIGRRVRVARSFVGINQDRVAEKIGVPQSNVAAWEGGTRAIPSQYIAGLCNILGTTPDFLFGFVDDYDPLTQHLNKRVDGRHVYQRIQQLTNLVLAWKRRALKAEQYFQMANDALALAKMEVER